MPVDPRPVGPVDFVLEPWTRDPNKGVTTQPVVTSVVSLSGRVAGGNTVTITGLYFRTLPDGTLPTVTFGGVPGTGVVVNSSKSISVVVPESSTVGTVDVSVTIGSETGTLLGGYLYFAGQIIKVDPPYKQLSGGVVTIHGSNLVNGSTFTVGGLPATNVTFIDESNIAITVPAHAVGWVDIVYTEAGGWTSTLRNGFQYTALTRGSDIRRQPGVTINKKTGSQGQSASFTVDGQSNKPVAGEEITLTDELDGNRELFKGIVMTVDQRYEGQTDQLAWDCQAQDFLFFFNRRRPFGTYTNVSASEIVVDLVTKYAPTFSTSFVQTKLALVSINLDGSRTMGEVFDALAQAIGGGRWYLDGRVVHFFHPPVPDDIVVPIDIPSGADFTAPVLSAGSTFGGPERFAAGYYAVRCTFVYSNGTESRLGPASNIYPYDGSKYIHIGSLPIGADPSGTITVVSRKIYFYKGTDDLASGWTVNDNSTTSIDVRPVSTDTDTTTVTNNIGDPVTVTDTGSGGTVTQPPPAGKSVLGCPIRDGFGFSGHMILVGGGIIASGPVNGFLVQSGLAYSIYRFKISVVYANGSESQPGGYSQPVVFGPVAVGGGPQSFTYFNGVTVTGRGFDVWIWDSPDASGAMDVLPGCPPILFRIYASTYQVPSNTANGGGWNPGACYQDPDAGYVLVGECPYFKTMTGQDHIPIDPNTPGGTTTFPVDVPIPPRDPDFGEKPKINPDDPTQTLTWPNPDGPYLENFTPPDDITNSNEDLLHEDSGSQPFVSTEDITQLRNRVKVLGAGTTLVAAAAQGASQLQVADSSVFTVNGGTLIAGNGAIVKFFSTSSLPSGNFVLLSSPLNAPIPNNTTLQYFSQAEDKASQLARGKVELDASGLPTDGIHEYVVNDPSLATAQQVYLRAQAEITVFSKPIVTIKYATRDAKSRVGSIVHVDMDDPPCKGDFMIQSVTIDQIHDESDMLDPRYTVVASTVRYELDSFLLALNLMQSQSSLQGGGGNTTGLVQAATTISSSSSQYQAIPIGSQTIGKRVIWGNASAKAAAGVSLVFPGQSGNWSITGGAFVNDNDGYWMDSTSSAGSQASFTAPTTFTRYELEPKLQCRFRLKTAQFPARVLIGLNELSGVVNTDTPSLTTQRGVFIRYSNIAGDAGWRVMMVNNAGITLSPVFLPVSRVTTIFLLSLSVTAGRDTSGALNGTFSMTVTLNGSSITITDGFWPALDLGFEACVQGVTSPSTAAIFGFSSLYMESN